MSFNFYSLLFFLIRAEVSLSGFQIFLPVHTFAFSSQANPSDFLNKKFPNLFSWYNIYYNEQKILKQKHLFKMGNFPLKAPSPTQIYFIPLSNHDVEKLFFFWENQALVLMRQKYWTKLREGRQTTWTRNQRRAGIWRFWPKLIKRSIEPTQ